jgi:predicted phage-related endonuclease
MVQRWINVSMPLEEAGILATLAEVALNESPWGWSSTWLKNHRNVSGEDAKRIVQQFSDLVDSVKARQERYRSGVQEVEDQT